MSRILFVMAYPGYLRHFGGVVTTLGRRGHEVLLAYDTPEKHSVALLPENSPSTVRAVGAVPAHSGRWRDMLLELGCTIDYIRFLSRDSGGTPYLRMRMQRFLSARFARLTAVRHWPATAVNAAIITCNVIERAVPPDSGLVKFLQRIQPDIVVVSPLVSRGPNGVQQTQLVKAARHLGLPVALAVGSWDHLSSKGLIRITPDLVIVWNDTQKHEAVTMHGIPARRIVVTGAQAFDAWFDARPSLSREAYLEGLGLPPGPRMILYAGSSRAVARGDLEIAFVKRWLGHVRQADDPDVREASVLIRPHPSNFAAWQDADLSEYANVMVWPRQRPAVPMREAEAADYFHALHHSAAVVGINTTAMIEAAILDKPVLTVQVAEFESTQAGTMHFHYLTSEAGGCVESAPSFEGHLPQLGSALRDPAGTRELRRQFIERFVRPRPAGRSPVENVAAAIEGMANIPRKPIRFGSPWLYPVRWSASKLLTN